MANTLKEEPPFHVWAPNAFLPETNLRKPHDLPHGLFLNATTCGTNKTRTIQFFSHPDCLQTSPLKRLRYPSGSSVNLRQWIIRYEVSNTTKILLKKGYGKKRLWIGKKRLLIGKKRRCENPVFFNAYIFRWKNKQLVLSLNKTPLKHASFNQSSQHDYPEGWGQLLNELERYL